jgi:hypothetical protein
VTSDARNALSHCITEYRIPFRFDYYVDKLSSKGTRKAKSSNIAAAFDGLEAVQSKFFFHSFLFRILSSSTSEVVHVVHVYGVRLCLNCGHQWACCIFARWYMNMDGHCLMILMGQPKNLKKNMPSFILATTNPAWTDMGVNPVFAVRGP